MTKNIKQIVRNFKKRIEDLYIRVENEEDKEALEDIMNYIDQKIEERTGGNC